MSTVLLVGEDEFLQQTRAAVLRTAGAVTVCCNGSSALAVQQGRNCDLVILCHSLPAQLSATLAESIHKDWPGTRILQVTAVRAWEPAVMGTAVDMVSSAEPERLVMRTKELLASRTQFSPPGEPGGMR